MDRSASHIWMKDRTPIAYHPASSQYRDSRINKRLRDKSAIARFPGLPATVDLQVVVANDHADPRAALIR